MLSAISRKIEMVHSNKSDETTFEQCTRQLCVLVFFKNIKMSESEESSVDDPLIVLQSIRNDYNARFRLNTTEYTFRFNENQLRLFTNFEEWYLACFGSILTQIQENVPPHYLIGLSVSIPSIEGTRPVGVPFTRSDQLTPQMIVDLLLRVIQSNQDFENGESLVIRSMVLHQHEGGSRG